MATIKMTADELRERVRAIMADSIQVRRDSLRMISPEGRQAEGEPTDEELEDFLFGNPLLEPDTADHLLDPGLLGFHSNIATLSEESLAEFEDQARSWAQSHVWLGGDEPLVTHWKFPEADESLVWRPPSPNPAWLHRAPSALLLAMDHIRNGRLLHELDWREFEELIGQLLESEGWSVTVTRPTRDGGIDVIAESTHPTLGAIQSLWQAKKYGPAHKVRLHEVRELSGVFAASSATKAVMVTTSCLTNSAIDWIKQDHYRLNYKDATALEKWVRRLMDQ